MKILMLSSELAPLAKTGGLGDAVASLGKTLAGAGHDVRIVLPRYGAATLGAEEGWAPHPQPVAVHLAPRDTAFCRVWTAPFEGTAARVHLVEHNAHFGSPAIYTTFPADAYRFAFLTVAALDFCLQTGWIPDVVHAHDWPAALAPVVMNTTRRATPVGAAASLFTIHNLQHQGLAPQDILRYLHLPGWLNTADNLECLGGINLMKGAIYHATKLTTVSPTYAREIQTPAHGFGLDPVLRHRNADLSGILNGMDTTEWNPETDAHLPAGFSATDPAGKAVCKAALQRQLALGEDPAVPLFGVVARLYDQKGLDLLATLLPDLLARAHMQIVLLGTGEKWLEEQYQWLARGHPGKCAVQIGFDNALAHRIEAASDFFLMPSRFEPCGLNQMYSMRYGTLPIAHATGGLADTVQDWTPPRTSPNASADATGTGLLFYDPTAGALRNAIIRALQLYYDNAADFARLRRNAMAQDFSWARSAARYESVYRAAIAARKGSVAAGAGVVQ